MNFFGKNAIKTMHIFPQSKLKGGGGGVEINRGVGLEIKGGGVSKLTGGWVCKLTGGGYFTYIQDQMV